MDWDQEKATATVAEFVRMPGGLLPALHSLQEAFGYVPAEAEAFLADQFNLTRAHVHGVISFYHDFRREKPGYHQIKVCGAEACQAVEGRDLLAHIEKKLMVGAGGTSDNGTFSLDVVYCLGNCAAGPAVMVDGRTYGRVTSQRFDQLISIAQKKRLQQGAEND